MKFHILSYGLLIIQIDMFYIFSLVVLLWNLTPL